MEPIEINAGGWYLRGVRDDDRISDAYALTDLGIDSPADYVARAQAAWADETALTWAVCVPTTGELIALIVARAGESLCGQARAGGEQALAAAHDPVVRFTRDALGWPVVE
ncbi:MAG: hypothetical protein QM673_01590 [Gordonia sp. (in: high G+C Gram-positive bacteria)]